MTENEKLTDKEIEHYHSNINIKSLFDETDGKHYWAVCCKKCGQSFFPYLKDMPKKKIDDALASHTCLEIKIKIKNDGK
jgi:uncharacterized OB-fold protein